MNIFQSLAQWREVFEYRDGFLFHKNPTGKMKKTSLGYDNSKGYLQVDFKNKKYKVHRVIWEMINEKSIPTGLDVDHINGKRKDNRIDNLRIVTRQHNMFNCTNAKGYHYEVQTKKYKAEITVGGKNKNLGRFNTEDEAREAYIIAKRQYHIIREVV